MAPKRRAPRKSTFTVRKEEKQRLAREIAALQAQLQALHDDLPSVATRGSSSASSAAATCARQRVLVRDRYVALMGIRSLLSSHNGSAVGCPTIFAEPIHLPRDEAARRAVLAQGSAARIRDARLLMRERCRFLDLSQPQVATEWFERDDLSMSMRHFDVTPFRGALRCSVRDVYDAVGYYAQNVEIIVSERLGHLTIREDDEAADGAPGDKVGEPRVSHRRLHSTTPMGLTVDANVTVFRQYFPAGACPDMPEEHAIFGTQSVESDELYPYVPAERVRHDLDGACIMQQVETRDGEWITTLARLSVSTRHSSDGRHPVPEEIQPALRQSAMEWGEVMLTAVREHIYALAVAREAARNGETHGASSSPSSSTASQE